MHVSSLFQLPTIMQYTGSAGKEWACNAGDLGSILGLGRSPGEGKDYPLQCSSLEYSMDCIVDAVAKSRTWLSNLHMQYKAASSFLAIARHSSPATHPHREQLGLYIIWAKKSNSNWLIRNDTYQPKCCVTQYYRTEFGFRQCLSNGNQDLSSLLTCASWVSSPFSLFIT